MNKYNPKKVVLVIGGHDPSGGAGIQADIESITHANCHAVSVITALTTQNTKIVSYVKPQVPEDFREQIKSLIEDIHIDACKIGMLGDARLIDIIHDELSDKKIPMVLDPVMASETGTSFTDNTICEKIINLLIPLAMIITPNSLEARILTKEKKLQATAVKLMAYGCHSVLITGTHEKTKDKVINSLYLNNGDHYHYSWQRLSATYHGSGCTLAARIAAQLALGNDIRSAVIAAQDYTWNTLKHGFSLGKGNLHPDRFFDK